MFVKNGSCFLSVFPFSLSFNLFCYSMFYAWLRHCSYRNCELHFTKNLVYHQILAMLGEQFMVGSEICGAVISVRFQVLYHPTLYILHSFNFPHKFLLTDLLCLYLLGRYSIHLEQKCCRSGHNHQNQVHCNPLYLHTCTVPPYHYSAMGYTSACKKN